MLEPYGGQLIDRRITGEAEVKLRSEAASFPKITISDATTHQTAKRPVGIPEALRVVAIGIADIGLPAQAGSSCGQ